MWSECWFLQLQPDGKLRSWVGASGNMSKPVMYSTVGCATHGHWFALLSLPNLNHDQFMPNLEHPKTHTHRLWDWRSYPKWLPTCLTQERWGGQNIYSGEDPSLSLAQTHSKNSGRDRICPLSPHLSLNKLDCVSGAVCAVWLWGAVRDWADG